jgi:hypothetical protein
VNHRQDGRRAPECSGPGDVPPTGTAQDLEVRVLPEDLSGSDASLRKVARALLALAYQVLEEDAQ